MGMHSDDPNAQPNASPTDAPSAAGFLLSQTDGRPLYLQLMEQVKRTIAVGEWLAGQEIPSIRQLAIQAQVSVITVKRAYAELEREGVIVTQHGKASTVAANPQLGLQFYGNKLAEHLQEAVRLAKIIGLSPAQLQTQLQETIEAEKGAIRDHSGSTI
jgi:GntR family transcriptional regulator